MTANPTNLRTPSLTPLTTAVRSAQIAPPVVRREKDQSGTAFSQVFRPRVMAGVTEPEVSSGPSKHSSSIETTLDCPGSLK